MSKAVNFTDSKLSALKAPDTGQKEISDAKVPGLRVRIGKSGARSFIVRKRVTGKIRNITLGRYGPQFGLADARKKARAILSDIEAGDDPKPSRLGGKGATIRALWPAYRDAKADKRSIREIERIFNVYVLPVIGDRLAEAVTRGDVTAMIDDIDAAVMARAVHAQLSAFYTWAMPRLDRLPANPCRDAGRPAKPKPRKRVLNDGELAALWKVAEAEPLPWGPGLLLLILTGQRRDEVFSADRLEFEIAERLWTVPAERAKNGIEHIVPISDPALAVLEAVPVMPGSDKLFPARSNPRNGPSGFSKLMNRIRPLVAREYGQEMERWTLHDLRRTMATGMQRTGVRIEVTEAVLNHVSGSRGGIVGVYQRHDFLDEKRHALDAWAAEVERIASGAELDNVVPINA